MMKVRLGLCFFCVALLTGCLVPERFAATVDVSPDGSYAYTYKGSTVHVLAAMQIKKGGVLSAKDEAGLKAEADKAAKLADVRKISYVGNGRYDLQIDGKKKPGERLKMMDFFNVSTDKSGIMTIASPEIKSKDKQAFEELGIKLDGTLDVKLPKNAEIISQNATSTPSFLGLFGTYSWKIGKLDQRPVMKIRLKS